MNDELLKNRALLELLVPYIEGVSADREWERVIKLINNYISLFKKIDNLSETELYEIEEYVWELTSAVEELNEEIGELLIKEKALSQEELDEMLMEVE